jgi:hypothetical protein
MKGYKEQLDFIKQNDLSVFDIIVANSCYYCFNFEYSDEEFEKLCATVAHAFLKVDGDNDCDRVACAINKLVDDGYSINEICEMSAWDILDNVDWL